MRYQSFFFVSLIYHSVSLWATDYTWIVNTGNWSDAANWSPTGFPISSADTATFNGSSTSATIDYVNEAADQLTFSLSSSSLFTINNSGGNSLTLGGGSHTQNIIMTNPSLVTISAPVVLKGNILINQGSTNNLTFSGGISDGANVYGITQSIGTGTTILSGTNSYTGPTHIAAGILQAGSTGSLPTGSIFTIDSAATLAIHGFTNTIYSLFGAGNVTTGTGTLTISNGGNFLGVISGTGTSTLNITGGSLTLSNTNTYSGSTTITSGGILALANGGSIASSSSVDVEGTFDVSQINTSTNINILTGSGSITLGGKELIVNTSATPSTFSGIIQGTDGSLTVAGTGMLTLETTDANTYTGTTTIISGATLQAGATDAFAPQSDYIVNGTLDLNSFANTIESLSGSTAGALVKTGSSSGILTIINGSNGGVFPGGIQGSGGLTLTGGLLDLTGTTNTYSGPTLINNATLQAGAAGALSSGSTVMLENAGQLNLSTFSNTISGLNGDDTTFVNVGSGATLTVSPNGGIFEGDIQGAGALTLNSGSNTLSLSGDNSFTGPVTITTGTLALAGSGDITSASYVTVNGTFDISAINSSTTINTLMGTGTINLGDHKLIVNTIPSPSSFFSGTIQGVGGSLTTQGTGTLTLSGTSSYTGTTTIGIGSTLQAGAVNAFAPLSDFIVSGTLGLQSNSNTIYSLSGTGNVTTGTGTLAISNGGNFSGVISGTGGSLNLMGGTLTLSNVNTYTGNTTITAGTLVLSGAGQLSSTSPVLDNGMFDISGISPATSTSIGDLSGNGVVSLGNNTLIVNTTSANTFSGSITNGTNPGASGSLTVAGTGMLTLGTTDDSTYTGTTTIISGATLQAGATDAFAPQSDYIVNGTLDLNSFANTIESLSGSTAGALVKTGSSSGILTIINGSNGGVFPGGIQGSGGLTLTGGLLDLTGTTNTYSGPTLINNATLQAGAAGALSSGSTVMLENAGQLNLSTFSNTISGLNGDDTTFVNVGSGATLTVSPNGGIFEGDIQGAGALTLNSGSNTLSLSGDNSFTGPVTIITGTLALAGSGDITSASYVTVNGTFDISAINSSTTINTLMGTGTINLGDHKLIVNTIPSPSSFFSGTIQGVGGSLTTQGTGTLTLSGTSSYTGTTTIGIGSTLQAGAVNAFAPLSDFIVSGTLGLQSNSNTIYSLSGTGNVTTGTGTLAISNGGNFSGVISGTGGSLNLMGGTLTLSNVNTYTGNTTITAGTLVLSGAGQLSSTSPVLDNGMFDISGISPATSTSIGDLSGNGVVSLGNNTLIVNTTSANTFSGSITNGTNPGASGSLTVAGTGMLTLGTTDDSTYTGTTTIISGATLQAGATDAFAPQSDFIVDGTLDLNSFANTIESLSGSTAGALVKTGSSSGILTITNGSNGGVFPGGIQGSGGLTLTGGLLDLTGTTNTYSGPTLINNATLQAGAAGALSSGSTVMLENAGQLNLSTFSNTISGLNGDDTTFVNVGSGATLTVSPNGGIFEGDIQGAGALTLNSGSNTLSLSGDNSFTGPVTITTGTLALAGSGDIASASSVTVNGTFDISAINSSTTINTLMGSGIINLGDHELIVNTDSSSSIFSGTIQGVGGSLITEGTGGTLTLSGTGSYTGPTTIGIGSTLQAGAMNAFAPLSAFTVTGTLDLQAFSNTIYSLSGSGSVIGTGGTLTINNGGTFSGGISGGEGLTLAGGTLLLNTTSSANSYSGSTVVANNSILSAGGTNALSPNSNMTITGSLLLNDFANTIASLSGTGTVNTGTIMTTGILTITNGSNGGTFSGGITGLGGLDLTGGTLKLATTRSGNTYSGPTNIFNSAILQAEAANAFSPFSDYTLNDSATLDLNGFSNTISSLSSSSASSMVTLGNLAILTINGGKTTTFAGQITNAPCGGLTIDGGTNLTLTNSANNYCGPTSILNGTLQISENGALAPQTDITIESLGVLDLIAPSTANTANSVMNSGMLFTQEPLTLTTTYTQTAGGLLDLQFETGAFGQILANTGISLDGTLQVSATGIFPTSGIFTLLSTTSGIVANEFSTFTPIGFGSSDPLLSYSLQSVDLFFSTCNNSWSKAGNGNWGDGTNWNGGCVPGANGNQNDVANFPTVAASSVIVTLADPTGDPESFTLFQLNLNSATTQYTIKQLSSTTTITFDANPSGTPLIQVQAGSHIINAPLILNQNTDLVLTDSTMLTFNSNTTLTSSNTQNFAIHQSAGSTTGSGLLINNTTLAPYSMSITSATVQNNDVIAPLNSLTIGGASGQNATVTNSGTAAQIGPSQAGGNLLIGGAGTTIVTNNGASATFGPSASGGDLTINGSGPTNVTNVGLGVKMGAFGAGGNVTVTSGIVNNESGALFQAGSGGFLTINGGTVNNDLTSTVGSSTENIVFTSGLLNTTGNVVAFNYTQSGSSILQLNLTSIPTIVGNVAATGTATIDSGSTLTVDALPGSVTTLQTTDLITAQKGVLGTYSNVNFLNFPAGIIPNIIYTPNAVELVTASTTTPTSVGSIGSIPSTSINEINFLVQRELHDLHSLIIKRKKKKKKKKYEIASNTFTESQLTASADSTLKTETPLGQISQNTERQEHLLAERVIEEEPNPSRFYFGPIDNFGRFQKRSTVQEGFGYNSIGVLTGIDHAFENFGLGLAADYEAITGKVNQHAGNFHLNQIHANAYAAWVPSCLEYFAVDAIVGYGYDWYNIHRKAGATQTRTTAKSNTHGMLVDALLGAEYIFSNGQFQAMPQNVLITPFLNLQYIGVKIDGFEEHHAGVYDLKVQSQHIRSLRSGLGTRFEYLVTCKNFTFKPEIDLSWQYEYLDHKRKIDFSTINLTQNHTVSKDIFGAGRNTLLFGVDFFFTIYKVFELEFSYDLQWNSLYINNAFYLGIGGNF